MALTATATERVCRDLAGLFGVSDECIFGVRRTVRISSARWKR